MQDYTKLKVWQKAHAVAMDILRESKQFRGRDIVTVRSQLQRAAHSVPTNIVEGCGKAGSAEFARYLEIALGSAAETHYHLLSSRDLGALTEEQFMDLGDRVVEVRRMLQGLIKRVRPPTP